MLLYIARISALIVAVQSLRCHLISYGNASDPNAQTTSSSLQDCPIGANACVKTTDYTRGVFSKQCQIGNCTSSSGMSQAPDNCFNSSSSGVVMSTCCCYGDGCNSAIINNTWLTAIISMIGFIAFC